MDCCVFIFVCFVQNIHNTFSIRYSFHQFTAVAQLCMPDCVVAMSLANVNSPEHILNRGGKKVWPHSSAQMEKKCLFSRTVDVLHLANLFCILFDVVEIITVTNQTLLGWDMKSGHGCPFRVKFLNLRTLLKGINFNSLAMNAISRQKGKVPWQFVINYDYVVKIQNCCI